ncbi:zinc finger protein 484-like isoform X2 [Achroia grisella]|uniref:zinc finger protein 484-like isoform X2 n=1 Tax=Achroia grisella TaxID=688607 RepID=UPI0027D206BA|nr:zinc finger protein 484-like isoform X2 [Achroia grisella]
MTREVDIKALVSHIVRGDGMDKCRICMGDTTEGQVYLEDTVMTQGDKAITLAELLETITGVEMENSRVMPQQICIQCYHSANIALPFVQLYQDSIKKIALILDNLKRIQIPKRRKSVYVMIDDEKIDKFVDTKSKTNTRSEDRLNNFKVRLNRRRRDKTANAKPLNAKLTCPDCEQPFRNLYKLNAHMKTNRKKMCHICKHILSTESFLKHVESHAVNIHKCNFCLETFESHLRYTKHRRKCHKVLSHFCVECKQGFESEINLGCHMTVHKPRVCSGCFKKFTSKSCFLNHSKRCNSKTNSSTQKYICDYCTKEYNYKNALKVHIMHNHLYGFQFQCEECGKRFSNRSNLQEHSNTHNKILDRYVCSDCGAKYSTRRGYERHSKKHATTKAYDLDNATGILKETNDKFNEKYECGDCKMKFCYGKSFRTHLMVKHHKVG